MGAALARRAAPGNMVGTRIRRRLMFVVRDIMYCKPGKVRPMVDKFREMAKLSEKKGLGRIRVMTDLVAERYWTLVAEFEVPTLSAFEEMMTSDAMQEFGPIMEGYHDLVVQGRREIYTLEN
jgi:hypothetical protein